MTFKGRKRLNILPVLKCYNNAEYFNPKTGANFLSCSGYESYPMIYECSVNIFWDHQRGNLFLCNLMISSHTLVRIYTVKISTANVKLQDYATIAVRTTHHYSMVAYITPKVNNSHSVCSAIAVASYWLVVVTDLTELFSVLRLKES